MVFSSTVVKFAINEEMYLRIKQLMSSFQTTAINNTNPAPEEMDEQSLSPNDLSINEVQVGDTEKNVCPVCKKKQKNILLHIKKSSQCKANVNEEQLQVLKDQSKKLRRKKVRINAAKCRKKAREQDEEKVKKDQNKWKQRSRAQASDEDLEPEKLMNYYYKIKSRNDLHNKKMEEAKQHHKDHNDIWNIDDGTCPSCREKKKNVLLHVSKNRECKAIVSPEDMKKLLDNSEQRRKIKRQDTYKNIKENEDKMKLFQESMNKRKASLQEISKRIKEVKDKGHDVGFETLKEMQNRWKAKSRKKARQKNHEAVKKYQRECTAKCREKLKREDPELHLARKQLTKFRNADLDRDNLMKVPRHLLKNYHRIDKYHDDTETDSDSDKEEFEQKLSKQIQVLNETPMSLDKRRKKLDEMYFGRELTIRRQIKILNDEELTKTEKKEKLLKFYWRTSMNKYRKQSLSFCIKCEKIVSDSMVRIGWGHNVEEGRINLKIPQISSKMLFEYQHICNICQPDVKKWKSGII